MRVQSCSIRHGWLRRAGRLGLFRRCEAAAAAEDDRRHDAQGRGTRRRSRAGGSARTRSTGSLSRWATSASNAPPAARWLPPRSPGDPATAVSTAPGSPSPRCGHSGTGAKIHASSVAARHFGAPGWLGHGLELSSRCWTRPSRHPRPVCKPGEPQCREETLWSCHFASRLADSVDGPGRQRVTDCRATVVDLFADPLTASETAAAERAEVLADCAGG